MTIMKYFKKKYEMFMKDSLYRNSVYLMFGTGIMAAFGFIFWIIVSRLYTVEQVGLATTIISVMGLITSFSLLGLNAGLIRFLPSSDRKNDKINTAFTLAALVTIIVTTIFLLGLKGFSPKLLFIKQNIFYSLAFIVFMVFSTLSSLIESVFLAYRSAGFILLINSIFSILKLIFPAIFVFLGAYGIFGSWMLAVIISFLITGIILTSKFDYNPKFVFYDSIIYRIGRYSFGNYIAGFIGGLGTMLLPLMITNLHYPEMTAYYYISMSIIGALFVIPQATSNSLFAEGSNNQRKIKEQVKKAIKIISFLMIPAIILITLLGKYVLTFFGQNYAIEGTEFLQILAISGIFVSINSVYSAIVRVKKMIRFMILVSIISASIVLGLSYISITNGYGLQGVGFSFLIGQIVSSIIYVYYVRK